MKNQTTNPDKIPLDASESPQIDENNHEPTPDTAPRQLTKEEIRTMTHDDVINHDPDRYMLYKNTAILDRQRGRIVKAPDKDHAPINKANAKQIAESRWKKAREAANTGLAEMYPENDPLYTWKEIIKSKADVALSKDNRAGTDAARFVGNAAGLLADPRQQTNERTAPGIQISIDTNTARQLLDAIAQYRTARSDPDEPIVTIDAPGTQPPTEKEHEETEREK